MAGSIIFAASQSINVAYLGLLFMGIGNIFQVRIGVSIISEITEKSRG